MPVSAAEVRQAFIDKVKTLRCPHCDAPFTDFAAEWYEAWSEGRHDALRELKLQERDGPVKLKCEACGGHALTSTFLGPPKAIGPA